MKIFKLLLIIFSLSCGTSFAVAKNESTAFDKKYFDRFNLAVAHIKELYVKNVAADKIFADAIQGILTGLDPHSRYLDEDDFKNMKVLTDGNFVGLGVDIIQEKGVIKVISPIDGTPAQRAGIKAGDFILSIDGQSAIDISLMKAIKLMRGTKGTSVTLVVISEKDKKPRKITVKREVIVLNTVKEKMLEAGFGYLRISHFQMDTAEKVKEAVRKLIEQSPNKQLKGLILDLRNNPGGVFESGVAVANNFLNSALLGPKRPIVSTKGRTNADNMVEYANAKDIINNAPLVVLINHGSASAAEIVAGALQDYKRAVIVGERSFGKGSVQTIFPLDNKTAIKLTTSLYYTPSGHSIQGEGIQPDVVLSELKIQQPSKETEFLWKVREMDLEHHLSNGKNISPSAASEENTQTNVTETSSTQLAVTDYQLYEALNLLKSLYVLRGK